MKKKVILLIILILMLSTLTYLGVYFSMKIAEVEYEYDQTDIEALKDVIKNYYTIMYVQMLYTIVLAKVLMRVDALYISQYYILIKDKKIMYYLIFFFVIIVLIGAGQLLYIDPYIYSGIILMLILGFTCLDLLFINKNFILLKNSN